MPYKLILVIALLFFPFVNTHAASADEAFKAGVEAFRKNDFEQARKSLQAAAEQEPTNPAIWYNLGLVEAKSGQYGLAVGFWRKALALDPSLDEAKIAEEWALKRLERAEMHSSASAWETLREIFLEPVQIWTYLTLTLLLGFAGAWLFLSYLGKRRLALLAETPLPVFPIWATVAGTLFVVSVALTAAKGYDLSVPRATIVARKVEARTTPDQESATLFDLFEGAQVIVRQSTQEWVQVNYPGGLTGWVPKSSVLQHSAQPL